MNAIVKTNYSVIREVVDRETALKAFEDRNEEYKIKIINDAIKIGVLHYTYFYKLYGYVQRSTCIIN